MAVYTYKYIYIYIPTYIHTHIYIHIQLPSKMDVYQVTLSRVRQLLQNYLSTHTCVGVDGFRFIHRHHEIPVDDEGKVCMDVGEGMSVCECLCRCGYEYSYRSI